MARRYNPKAKRFQKLSGAQVGAAVKRVYICAGCDMMAVPGAPKPAQCGACGRMDFLKFDSEGECGRWHELRQLERAVDPALRVTNLQRQIRFDLNAALPLGDGKFAPVKVGEYWADFTYTQNGETVVDDYKGGAMTELASWKLRHMKAQGITVKTS